MLANSMQKGTEGIDPVMFVFLTDLVNEKKKAISSFHGNNEKEKIDMLSSFISMAEHSFKCINKFIETVESDSSPERDYYSHQYSLFKELSEELKKISSEILDKIKPV